MVKLLAELGEVIDDDGSLIAEAERWVPGYLTIDRHMPEATHIYLSNLYSLGPRSHHESLRNYITHGYQVIVACAFKAQKKRKTKIKSHAGVPHHPLHDHTLALHLAANSLLFGFPLLLLITSALSTSRTLVPRLPAGY